MPVDQEVIVIYAATQGHMDDVPLNRIQEFQNGLLAAVDASAPQLRKGLAEKRELTKEFEEQLKQAIGEFKTKMWKK
jgi:F-type H+-transporting ATPase subunit alpha